jgi:hypothetical protein
MNFGFGASAGGGAGGLFNFNSLFFNAKLSFSLDYFPKQKLRFKQKDSLTFWKIQKEIREWIFFFSNLADGGAGGSLGGNAGFGFGMNAGAGAGAGTGFWG